MDPGYETVVDPSTMVWTLSAMVIHGVMVAVQAGLIVFLIATGIIAWLAPGLDAQWLRRLGVLPAGTANVRAFAAARVALGIALLLPIAVGAPLAVSLGASVAALVLLIASERALSSDSIRPGRIARRVAIGSAAIVAAFMLWEGEDGLALGSDVIVTAQGWRTHELDWQLANDRKAPKVGDLAPDFELQDPSGRVAVRLSDFRDSRPVALVFGSYT
jgi:hypothetical protein